MRTCEELPKQRHASPNWQLALAGTRFQHAFCSLISWRVTSPVASHGAV